MRGSGVKGLRVEGLRALGAQKAFKFLGFRATRSFRGKGFWFIGVEGLRGLRVEGFRVEG